MTHCPSDPPSSRLFGDETILVIDDDDRIRVLVDQILSRYGYTVLQAADGQEGLDLYSQHGDIDLVLLDLSMPGLQGEEVLQRLRYRSPDIKVILFTGFAEDEEMLAGARAIIYKPFPVDSMVRKIREVLDS